MSPVRLALLCLALAACDPAPRGEDAPAPSARASARVVVVDGRIRWVAYDAAGLAAARAKGRPVFVRIDADWDVNGVTVLKKELETAPVRAKLQATKALAMRADFTDDNPAAEKLLVDLGRSGVPVFVVFPPRGEAMALEEPVTAASVVRALERAAR